MLDTLESCARFESSPRVFLARSDALRLILVSMLMLMMFFCYCSISACLIAMSTSWDCRIVRRLLIVVVAVEVVVVVVVVMMVLS